MIHYVTLDWNDYHGERVRNERREVYEFSSTKAMKDALLEKWTYGAHIQVAHKKGDIQDFMRYATTSECRERSTVTGARPARMTPLQHYESRPRMGREVKRELDLRMRELARFQKECMRRTVRK